MGPGYLCINSPANPTGAVESRDTIRDIVEYGMDAGVTIVSDEVYEHFIYGKEHVSAATFGDDVITVNAVSKTYAMTGWRLGYLAAPEEYITPCVKGPPVLPGLRNVYLTICVPCGLSGDQSPVTAMRKEYQARRDLIYKGFQSMGIDFPIPEGAFYAFVPMDQPLISRILSKGVVIVPGSAFGNNAPDYARLSMQHRATCSKRPLARIQSAL